MLTAFAAGAAAGYGIAIPVGAIAILILETGLRRGFRLAAAAGAGAATVDGLYALVAAAFGAALAGLLAPVATPLRVVAVVALVAIAVRGFMGLRRAGLEGGTEAMRSSDGGPGLPANAAPAAPEPAAVEAAAAAEAGGSAARTYAAFLGLTLLNPITVTYFAALILGLASTGAGPAEKASFVAGAFLASLSWQLALAAVGAVLHRRLSPRLRAAVIVAGNAIILGFAAVITVDLLR